MPGPGSSRRSYRPTHPPPGARTGTARPPGTEPRERAVPYRTSGPGPPGRRSCHVLARDLCPGSFSIDEAPLAYERLHAGRINGRAVILPHG
ncbi:hypothetical protein F0344_33285 [Streptomyces finlayi]|uniref:Zinc-binding dehydrogenase n=1 Tax=Streptomyces finlayi TaxID=67296 RepID=A0A7G7BU13_9ACTN|nr:hypothetical protein F0344_33285 [Streptomyces finlayi]